MWSARRAAVACAVVAAAAAGVTIWIQRAQIADLRAAHAADQADLARQALRSAGAILTHDVPAPPVPSQLQGRVDAVRRAAPEARTERTEDVQTGWIEAQGPVLPCLQNPSNSPPSARDAEDHDVTPRITPPGALLRPGDRFRIRLVSVDLSTPQGATGTVGEGELLRFDGASLGRGPLDQDASTVWRRQRPQERPRWFAMPMAGVTSRARAWAGVAIGRGRWGATAAYVWRPGQSEVLAGVALRF